MARLTNIYHLNSLIIHVYAGSATVRLSSVLLQSVGSML